jgi:hypothetical protein
LADSTRTTTIIGQQQLGSSIRDGNRDDSDMQTTQTTAEQRQQLPNMGTGR